MENFCLTPKQVAALKVLHKAQRDRRRADRIKSIVLLGTGWSVSEVAQALLVDESTVRLWLEKYQQEGTDGLLTLHYQGKESSLTAEQQEKLAQHLDETIYQSSHDICIQYVQRIQTDPTDHIQVRLPHITTYKLDTK